MKSPSPPQPASFEADLSLASELATGSAEALRRFEQEVLAPVSAQLKHGHQAARVDEALQSVREWLLVGPESAARVRSYSGRGALKGWVAAIAVRKLLELERREGRYDSLSAVENAVLSGGARDADYALLQARYAPLFKDGLTRGVETLPRRHRLVLRMSTLDGLSVDKIGAVFHVHRSTAARWLAEARQHLHDTAMAHVKSQAEVPTAQLPSLSRVVLSQTELSLPRLLSPMNEDDR